MTTQVVFNVDKVIKAQAMRRAKNEGIPFSAVLKFATKAFAEGNLSLSVTQSEVFNEKTARIIRAAMRDAKTGKNIVSFKSNKEMDEYLLSL